MNQPKVRDVLEIINQIAPFERAEPWDNVGLLAGSLENPVSGILCALDFTEEALDDAISKNVNLIVTHHPILFSGRKRLTEDDYEGRLLCKMIRNRINLIAAHTNYDIADGGVNDCLAEKIGLRNIRTTEYDEDGILRIGEIEPLPLSCFALHCESMLGDVIRKYGDPMKIIARVAVCGGSGGEYARAALKAGCDAYLTGEMRYHDSLDLMHEGLATLHAGHDATERIAINPLKEGLQNRLNAIEYNVRVF